MRTDYLIKYITFDQLLSSVRDDLETYDAEGLIDSSKLIKVVRKCNRSLGIKIHKERETLLTVENFRAKLPDDFFLFNFGLLCTKWEKIEPKVEGTYTEDFWVQLGCNVDACPKGGQVIVVPDTCAEKAKLCVNAKGDYFTIMQRFRNEIRQYSYFDLVKLKMKSQVSLNKGCFNLSSTSKNEIQIQGEYVYTNFCDGDLYINYIGDMIDEQNNLLVLDHPLVTDFYEYALKRRIFENLYLDQTEDLVNKLKLVEERYVEAKKIALKFADTPEFSELEQIWRENREYYYKRYYYPIAC